jgi:hypothetical protein
MRPRVGVHDGVEDAAVLRPWGGDQHGGSAVRGVPGEGLGRLAAGCLEGRLQHEVLRRIARQEELGKDDEVGTGDGGIGAGGAGFGEVAGDVPHDRVELGDGDQERGGRLGHERDVTRGPGVLNAALAGVAVTARRAR